MTSKIAAVAAMLVLCAVPGMSEARERWTATAANSWYAKQPWPVGADYIPADAINEFEMWQQDTFNPKQIDWELGLAEHTGMTTMRVFLQDQLWQQDPEGFKKRIDIFLGIAAKHHIKPLLVLFDSCWDPNPHTGKQHDPIPGVHNSGWAQSPGTAELEDTAHYGRLEAYVKGVVGAFARDERIIGWDVWNEPDNGMDDFATPNSHANLIANLLPQVYDWVRSQNPVQPTTSGLYNGGDWTNTATLNPIQKMQLAQSDILSFHDYGWPEGFENRVRQITSYGRPVFCTEYMARGAGSTIDTILPIGKKYNIAMFNWGLVDGKTQTRFPWESIDHPYVKSEPMVWHHDLFHKDGSPYRQREIDIIRQLTGYKAP